MRNLLQREKDSHDPDLQALGFLQSVRPRLQNKKLPAPRVPYLPQRVQKDSLSPFLLSSAPFQMHIIFPMKFT